jgi:cytoskeletal protein RodZ
MSTKLSLFSRAVAVAGVLALSLPAFAQTNQPAAAPTSQPAAPAASTPAASPASVVNKTDKQGKSMKDTKDKHAAKKPLVKTAKNTETHKTVKPASVPAKTEQQPAVGGAK